LDKVSTIREGIDLAKSLVENGKVAEKLEQFVKSHGSLDKLETWKKEIKL
jgi:anthranilate phosphoribosyltransferase